MIHFTLNGETVLANVDPSTPLLWVVRDHFKLKGSKFGCGAGLCGACTMHVDGAALKTCVTPIAAVANKAITTIEGLAPEGELTDVQQAFLDAGAVQCGFCTPGLLVAIDRLLDDPRYGEHWARFWLDLVRYSDSDGWNQDALRPHIWEIP